MNLSEDFKLQFNIEHEYLPGTFEQKYIDHYCNGNKLTNMEEFIANRLHFAEFGVYTNATPNSHPNSQWMKFWREEKRRCIEGYNIGRDWIPGYLYFYWNYTPIHRVKVVSQKEGPSKGPDHIGYRADPPPPKRFRTCSSGEYQPQYQ